MKKEQFNHLGYILILLMNLLGAQHSAAQGLSNTFVGLGGNNKAPIKMQMDKVEINEEKKVATLSGNVVIQQGDAIVKSAIVYAYFRKNFGSGGVESISKLVAKGNVRITSLDQVATSKMAVFHMSKQHLTMTGNVTLTKGKNVIKGEVLSVNLVTGVATLKGGEKKNKKKRVTITFEPGSKKKK